MDELSAHVRPFRPAVRPSIHRESPVKWIEATRTAVTCHLLPPLPKKMYRKGRSMNNDKNLVPPRRDGESDIVARNNTDKISRFMLEFLWQEKSKIFFYSISEESLFYLPPRMFKGILSI